MHGGKQRPQRRVGQGRVASSRMVLDHLPAPMGFVDRNLRVRCINQAGCRIYGYRSQREVLGRTVPETIGAMTYARLRHAVEAAHEDLADRRVFVVDEAAWNELEALLDRPPLYKPRLAKVLANPSVLEQPPAQ